jgi:hypothetical protein
MKALIDLDILPYSYGSLTFDDGALMPINLVQRMVDERIESIVRESGADNWVGYLTDSGSNFRLDVATILPYKGNRSGKSKPPLWEGLRNHLLKKYPDQVTEVSGIEADDQLAIDQYQAEAAQLAPGDTIICTIDKDLLMVPGWHYNPDTKKKIFVTEIEGLRSFYKQLLTGDSVDNIKGLFGVGKASKLLKKIDDMDDPVDMFKHVFDCYYDRFGLYAERFMQENGVLLWMLQSREDSWVEHYHQLCDELDKREEKEEDELSEF